MVIPQGLATVTIDPSSNPHNLLAACPSKYPVAIYFNNPKNEDTSAIGMWYLGEGIWDQTTLHVTKRPLLQIPPFPIPQVLDFVFLTEIITLTSPKVVGVLVREPDI